jgi:hypothetical protein
VALAAAKALEALGEMPTACLAEVSGNAIKNAESVTVPGTDVLKEIRTAVVAGVIGGQPELGWGVLSQIAVDEIEEINDFLQDCPIQILASFFALKWCLLLEGISLAAKLQTCISTSYLQSEMERSCFRDRTIDNVH